MIKDILYRIFFVVTLPITYFIYAMPSQILGLLKIYNLEKKLITAGSTIVAGNYLKATGSNVAVEGLENLPDGECKLCFVSNHQSFFDILVIIGYIPVLVGFLAKKELTRIPMLHGWMKGMNCVFLDRSSPHAAVKAIDKGVKSIREGNAIVLFPEGTRSRSPKMGSFKSGSLKLAIRAEAIIVPLTINHSYKIYEENKRVKKAEVKLVIHKPVDVSIEENKDSKALADKLWNTINSGLV
jgi:1-acyl-sn-glycerol-3-phosphate acyltransferase